MSAIAAAVKHMLAAGMPHDAIVAAVAEMEAAASARPRGDARQERNRRHYEKKKAEKAAEADRLKASEKRLNASEQDASETRLKASESVLNSDAPRARVRELSPRLVISGLIDADDSASARDQSDDWPSDNLIAELVEAVASPRLDPAKQPGLTLTAGRVAAWKRDGASWRHDVIPVVTALCAKTKTPVASWKFFDAAMAQSIADNRAALEIPEARSIGPPVASITERIAAEQAEARRRAFEIMDKRAARNG